MVWAWIINWMGKVDVSLSNEWKLFLNVLKRNALFLFVDAICTGILFIDHHKWRICKYCYLTLDPSYHFTLKSRNESPLHKKSYLEHWVSFSLFIFSIMSLIPATFVLITFLQKVVCIAIRIVSRHSIKIYRLVSGEYRYSPTFNAIVRDENLLVRAFRWVPRPYSNPFNSFVTYMPS